MRTVSLVHFTADGWGEITIALRALTAIRHLYIAVEVGLGGAWPQWFVSATPELKSQVPSNVLYVFALP